MFAPERPMRASDRTAETAGFLRRLASFPELLQSQPKPTGAAFRGRTLQVVVGALANAVERSSLLAQDELNLPSDDHLGSAPQPRERARWAEARFGLPAV
jgi:hypothetical protein